MKRVLSFLLVLAMLLSMSLAVYAAEETGEALTEPVETVEVEPVEVTVPDTDQATVSTSGTWDTIQYTVYSDGRLTLTGSGTTPDVRQTLEGSTCPWYAYRTKITSITVGEGITGLGKLAFYNHIYVTDISLPSTLMSIGERAFDYCIRLTSLHIPAAVQTIGEEAFYCLQSNTAYSVESGNRYFTTDSYGALFTMDMKTLVAYPAGSSTTSYTVPQGVELIGMQAFMYAENLDSVYLPDTVKRIDVSGFFACKGMTYIDLGDGLEVIEAGAFIHCESLLALDIPDSVHTIAQGNFQFCYDLEEIKFPAKLTVIEDNMFYDCNALTEVVIPYGVTEIKRSAFSNSPNLERLWVPVTLVTVGMGAFHNCNAIDTVYYDGRQDQWEAMDVYVHDYYSNSSFRDALVEYEFDINLYRAKYLNENDAAYNGLVTGVYADTPSQILLEAGEDNGLGGWSVFWTAFDEAVNVVDKPSALAGYVVMPETLYTAVILSALQESYNESVLDAVISTAQEDFLEPMKEIVEGMQKLYNIDLVDPQAFKAMDAEQRKTFQTLVGDLFQLDMPEIKSMMDFADWMDIGLSAARDINAYFEYLSLCSVAANVSDSMITVLERGRSESQTRGNSIMTAAFDNALDIIEDSKSNFVALAVSEGFMVAGRNAGKFMLDNVLWGEVKTTMLLAYPEVAVLYGAVKAGDFISNMLFNTDATAEKYLELAAVCDVEDVMLTVFETLSAEYYDTEDDEEAEAFLSAVDFTYVLRKEDCKRAYDFVDVVSDAAVSQMQAAFASGGTAYDTVKKSIESIRNSYNLEYYSHLTGWIDQVDVDYPNMDLYDRYSYLLNRVGQQLGYTEYVIACPVDVFVYDASGDLVAYVSGSQVWADGSALIAKNGGTKTVRLYDGSYTIKCVGTGSGTMDVTIRKVDGDGDVTRTVNYNDLPLTNGKTYTANSGEYTLNSGGSPLQAAYDSNSSTAGYTVSIVGGVISRNGTVAVETTVAEGEVLQIEAYVPAGMKLVGWEATAGTVEDPTAVSTTYTAAAANGTITAVLAIDCKTHSWDSGVVTVEPTEETEGTKVYTCKTCGETKIEVLPALGYEVTVTRIAGPGRCETAVQAADQLKAQLGVDEFDAIIIASGSNFADALAGSYLAAVKSAPILLYRGESSITLNEDYIQENLSDNGVVYLLGGEAAVPAEVEAGLNALGVTVERLAGASRYDTNLAILEEAGVQPGDEILVATAKNFADSLSASATGKPILLVNGTGASLSADQMAYLEQYGGGKITILGGEGAVSAAIETQLSQYGTVKRLAGQSRYETSVKIAEEYFGSVDTVVIAYGKNFPDGLSGGPVAYAKGAPLVLTAAGAEGAAKTYMADHPVRKGYIMGGTGALSEETVARIFGE